MIPFTACLFVAIAGQAGASGPVSTPAPADTQWAFQIERDTVYGFRTARARNAPLDEIGKRLETILKVPVHVSQAIAKSRISFSRMDRVSFDEVLVRLAPAVYVDSREIWGETPQILGIQMLDDGEVAPVVRKIPGLVSEGIAAAAVNGETPSGSSGETQARSAEAQPVDPPAEGPFLIVRIDENGRISIDSRSQALGVLLFEVARVSGARFNLGISEAPMVSQLSVNGILPSELPGLLAIPGVGVDVRRNLLSGRETALCYFVNDAP